MNGTSASRSSLGISKVSAGIMEREGWREERGGGQELGVDRQGEGEVEEEESRLLELELVFIYRL